MTAEPEFAPDSGIRRADLDLCHGCGTLVARWELDDTHYGPCCIDPGEQQQRNEAGFAAARAALQAARAKRSKHPAAHQSSNLWAVHRDDDVGAGDG
jgi:hypothetical protein